MKISQSKAYRRQPVKTLPKKLITRLRLITQHPYRCQVDSLSTAHPKTNDAHQWYLPHDDLPYHHIMETFDHGNLMVLYAHIPRLHSILKLEKRYSGWEILSLSSESSAGSLLPERFRSGSGWMLKPATRSQTFALAKQLSIPVRSLPELTAYNVQLLIQTTLVMRHLPYVNKLIENVVLSEGLYSGLQHVRSNALKSF